MGRCSGYAGPGYVNRPDNGYVGRGRGFGRGFARGGGFGRGGGRGWWGIGGPGPYSREHELQELKDHTRYLTEALDEANRRIEEIESDEQPE